MTWSKALIFILNTMLTTLIFFIISSYAIDLKLACGVYACYILIYMFVSDFISGLDRKTTSNILKKEKEVLCKKLDDYKSCMKDAHHKAVYCLTPGKKATEIRYEIQILVNVLSDVAFGERESSNDYSPMTRGDKKPRVESEDVTVFETLSAGNKRG
ncbi:hypothetical protein [Dickeya undicola]|uniref:hypothetical protein n=1 Tax=Dickeya undicola TaxID=1577887 RepID=UPI000532E947|nr:hypothetical protein [Dickeya undicola]